MTISQQTCMHSSLLEHHVRMWAVLATWYCKEQEYSWRLAGCHSQSDTPDVNDIGEWLNSDISLAACNKGQCPWLKPLPFQFRVNLHTDARWSMRNRLKMLIIMAFVPCPRLSFWLPLLVIQRAEGPEFRLGPLIILGKLRYGSTSKPRPEAAEPGYCY
ncbi:hypothetical protein BDZ97DRAFT_1764416 [Flammula alnicola]|nr:hypothetical protein BDZ97DRAFT_1764416 [Flammula alnicola]